MSKSRFLKIVSTVASRSKGRDARSMPTLARSCFISSAYLLKVGKCTMSSFRRIPFAAFGSLAASSVSSAFAGLKARPSIPRSGFQRARRSQIRRIRGWRQLHSIKPW